jgi:hypothetical protein
MVARDGIEPPTLAFSGLASFVSIVSIECGLRLLLEVSLPP